MSDRIVVTGVGLVTPSGEDAARLAQAADRGESRSFGPPAVPGFLADPARVVGVVADPDPEQFLDDRKHLKYMDTLSRLIVRAAGLAMADARIERRSIDPFRVGTFLTIGFVASELRDLKPIFLAARTPDGRFDPAPMGARCRINPISVFRSLPNIPACNVSIALGFRGDNTVLYPGGGQACMALQDAVDAIREGRADVALAGAAAQASSFLTLHTLRMMGLMDPGRSLPPADGAAVLVLESRDHAASRQARVVGEIVDVAVASCEARPYEVPDGADTLGRVIAQVTGGVAGKPALIVAGHDGTTAARAVLAGALGPTGARVVETRPVTGNALGANFPLDLALALSWPGLEPGDLRLVPVVGCGPEVGACLLAGGPS